MPSVGTFGPWGQVGGMIGALSSKKKIEEALDKNVEREAQRIRTSIVKEFTLQGPSSGGWAPLSPATIAMRIKKGRKSTKALIDTGFMRKSVKVTQEDEGVYFVGIHRNVKTKGTRGRDASGRFTVAGAGAPLVNIAAVHEFGANITFFGKPARIPARPFLFSVWKKESKKSEERVVKGILKDLGIPGGMRL